MKDEKKLIQTERESEREHLCMIHPLSNIYSEIQESEQVRKSRMKEKTE